MSGYRHRRIRARRCRHRRGGKRRRDGSHVSSHSFPCRPSSVAGRDHVPALHDLQWTACHVVTGLSFCVQSPRPLQSLVLRSSQPEDARSRYRRRGLRASSWLTSALLISESMGPHPAVWWPQSRSLGNVRHQLHPDAHRHLHRGSSEVCHIVSHPLFL